MAPTLLHLSATLQENPPTWSRRLNLIRKKKVVADHFLNSAPEKTPLDPSSWSITTTSALRNMILPRGHVRHSCGSSRENGVSAVSRQNNCRMVQQPLCLKQFPNRTKRRKKKRDNGQLVGASPCTGSPPGQATRSPWPTASPANAWLILPSSSLPKAYLYPDRHQLCLRLKPKRHGHAVDSFSPCSLAL